MDVNLKLLEKLYSVVSKEFSLPLIFYWLEIKIILETVHEVKMNSFVCFEELVSNSIQFPALNANSLR